MVDLEHFHQSTINISTFQTNNLLTKIASSDIKQNWKPWQTTTVYAKKHKKQSTQPTKLYKTCKNPGRGKFGKFGKFGKIEIWRKMERLDWTHLTRPNLRKSRASIEVHQGHRGHCNTPWIQDCLHLYLSPRGKR